MGPVEDAQGNWNNVLVVKLTESSTRDQGYEMNDTQASLEVGASDRAKAVGMEILTAANRQEAVPETSPCSGWNQHNTSSIRRQVKNPSIESAEVRCLTLQKHVS